MKTARLNFNKDRFGRTGTGNVHGDLALQIADEFFPDRNWNDFVVVVLSWWCEAVLLLLRGGTEARVRFMEGPFLVRIRRTDKASWRLTMIEAGLKTRVLQEEDVDAVSLAESVLVASEMVIGACEERDWGSRDLSELRKVAGSLKTMLIARE